MRNANRMHHFISKLTHEETLIFHKISLNIETRYYQIYHFFSLSFSLYNLKELFYTFKHIFYKKISKRLNIQYYSQTE